jgi:hypothetical protein
MPEKISTELKLDALIMHAKGVKQEAVAAAYEISESTIKRAKARYAKYGDLEAGYEKPGKKPLFGPCMRDVSFNLSVFKLISSQEILSMVYKVPEAYLDEYSQRIKEVFHVKVSR